MTQAFLNETSIEAAHERYLKRWHLASVQEAWNGRKPSLAQFKKRFGKAYESRQKYLERVDNAKGGTQLAIGEREDVVQAVAERLLELMGGNVEAVVEPEVENLGSADDLDEDDEKPASVLDRLKGRTKPSTTVKDDEPKFVKPENFDELPRSGQVYFFLHRAKEAGFSYAIVPIKRGVIAECISQIKDDGRAYQSVAANLVKSK